MKIKLQEEPGYDARRDEFHRTHLVHKVGSIANGCIAISIGYLIKLKWFFKTKDIALFEEWIDSLQEWYDGCY